MRCCDDSIVISKDGETVYNLFNVIPNGRFVRAAVHTAGILIAVGAESGYKLFVLRDDGLENVSFTRVEDLKDLAFQIRLEERTFTSTASGSSCTQSSMVRIS